MFSILLLRYKVHKYLCVCFCLVLCWAVVLGALDFPVGGPASETTFAMTGVASPIPAGNTEETVEEITD